MLSASVSGIITCLTPQVTATATRIRGTQPYSYLWPDGQTGPQAGITSGGTYVVTVTDGNSCTKTASVNVNQNINTPQANATSPGDLTCSSPVQTLSGGRIIDSDPISLMPGQPPTGAICVRRGYALPGYQCMRHLHASCNQYCQWLHQYSLCCCCV
jgi:hypothetical protein